MGGHTENALASGYVPAKGQPSKPDLLTQIADTKATCLVIKDLSPLFSAKEDRVRAVLGDLTSIYDGEYTKATSTRGLMSYTPRFAIVACGTPITLEKHRRYMAQIGQRFLKSDPIRGAARGHAQGVRLCGHHRPAAHHR